MESARIRLRRWCEGDAEALFKYASDPEVGPRAGWPPHLSVDDSLNVINTIFSSEGIWAIILKETQEPIGSIGYIPHGFSNIPIEPNDCEIGYWVAKPYWNQGICTEALELVLDYCINTMHFDTIWSDHFVSNPASGRVLEKCGFAYTGIETHCPHLLGGDNEPIKILKFNKKHFPCKN